MKALIDIKTPAGQSLVDFPKTICVYEYTGNALDNIADALFNNTSSPETLTLHPGDTITIKIEE